VTIRYTKTMHNILVGLVTFLALAGIGSACSHDTPAPSPTYSAPALQYVPPTETTEAPPQSTEDDGGDVRLDVDYDDDDDHHRPRFCRHHWWC